MPKRKRLLLVLFLCLFCFAVLAGCKGKNAKVEGEALDITVLSKEDIPEELQKVIEEHKTQEITMSYQAGDALYIVRGYGQQETGGYSISVEACVLADDGIHVLFQLHGPAADETIVKEPSWPCVVLKLPYREGEIFFD